MVKKLIRDNVPQLAAEEGDILQVREMEDEEFLGYAKEKLVEEAEEVQKANTPEELLSELADTLELIITVAEVEGMTLDIIDEARRKKLEKAGGFSKRLLLLKGSSD